MIKMVEDKEWIKVEHRDWDEWEMDPKSYVLIRLKDEKIEVCIMAIQDPHKQGDFVKEQKELEKYCGDHPIDIYYQIIQDGWITNMQHAAYLGCELQKAYTALKKGVKYIQDEELNL